MNDSELKQKLAAWKLSPASQQAQSRAEWCALTTFRNRATERIRTTASRFPRTPWSILAGFGAVAILFIAAFFSFRPAPASSTVNPTPLLAELEDFFQGRLAAVIQHDGELDLQLTEVPAPRPADQRVAVRIEWQNEHFLILTYSGNSVCLDTSAGRLCVTPLINGSREVILLGESGLLEHQPGLRAEARTLQDT